jgi:uncharacterized phage protein (TIGR01671 family)
MNEGIKIPSKEDVAKVCGGTAPIGKKEQHSMREIKFRAWDTERKHLIISDALNDIFLPLSGDTTIQDNYESCESQQAIVGFEDFIRERPELILQQFTGLFDKNGKEIWEGDILDLSGGTLEVIFNYGSFGYMCCGFVTLSQHNYLDRCEVIGNVHENPELLETP